MPKDHLARLPLADVFLDNHPYNAGSTANDVLLMGLPLLTLSGKTFVSRMGGSLLTSLGIPELITFSHEDYENRAVALANNPAEVASLRQRLATAIEVSRPTIAKTFTKNLESLLAQAAGFTPSAAAPVAPKAAARPGQKTVLVRGWRDINHSFSLVNQFQLIEMLQRPDLFLFHQDMPYASPAWSPAQNGSGFEPDTARKIAEIPRHQGEDVDVALSISSPFSLYQGPAKKVVTFMVTEFGVDHGSFVPGSPAPAAFTEGRNWVVTPSNWSKHKLVVAGMNPEQIVIVPHGVDTRVFRPTSPEERALVRQQLSCNPGHFMMLNVGGAFWNKGGDLLLRAYAELKREFSHLKLVIKDNRTLYGRTTDEMVANLEKANPGLFTQAVIEGIVMLPTAMSMDQLRFLYSAADLYVSPYRAEGFNLPVLEAMACRTRVLTTGGGATDDFHLPGICEKLVAHEADPAKTGIPTKGTYLEPDYEDLKNKLRVAVLRKDQPLGISEADLSAFLNRWTWQGATEQLLRVMGV
jgi:glycosyltransferase involved in cell wall biosynthesis